MILVVGLKSATWKVGPTRTYTLPSQVSGRIANGDTVEIDAGVYPRDVARWTASNIVIRCNDGYARLPSGGLVYGGKAIWVISGDNVSIDHIVFSQAACVDQNGAGIRHEGRNMVLRHCVFMDNENGILGGAQRPCSVTIEYCEFARNGFGDGYSHNLYIGNIDTLLFRFNYSHHAKVGHELKSRARVNVLCYNRISNESDGTASRNIDLPNGGTAILIGNILQQGPNTQNSNMMAFGLEGLSNPAPHRLIAANNTFVNERTSGSFVQMQSGTGLFSATNNLIVGVGSFFNPSSVSQIDTASNLLTPSASTLAFRDGPGYDYHLNANSRAIDKGVQPGSIDGWDVRPLYEYVHPNSMVPRCLNSLPDIGAYEYCLPSERSEEQMDSPLLCFPNPAHDLLIFDTTQPAVSVFNAVGECVATFHNVTVIDVRRFDSGVYLLHTDTQHCTLAVVH